MVEKPRMDLEHVFDEMEIAAEPFALCELHGRSRLGLGLGRRPCATLHYVLAGKGELEMNGRRPLQVSAGTLALVPALQPHALTSLGERGPPLPDCRPAALGLALHRREAFGAARGGALLALCADVRIGLRGTGGLVDLLREPITAAADEDASMAAPLERLLHELATPSPGSRAMVRLLLLQCMIVLFRERLQAGDRSLHWMAALADERLWTALQRMLDGPGDRHSVESLAESAGMSRSAFAHRFAAIYGSGPMELLRDLRMHLAASLLTHSDLPVKRIAELSGFKSRSAFTGTFTGRIGLSPQQFRDDARRREETDRAARLEALGARGRNRSYAGHQV